MLDLGTGNVQMSPRVEISSRAHAPTLNGSASTHSGELTSGFVEASVKFSSGNKRLKTSFVNGTVGCDFSP